MAISFQTQGTSQKHKYVTPYKALGPNVIPNIVLNECAELMTLCLLYLFRVTLKSQFYSDEWRESIICVICQPGKAKYHIPKAYMPIILLNTMVKLLLAIVAKDMSFLAEKHSLLLKNHFCGRPGRTTTDSLHLLVDTIQAVWRRKQVVSVLFLNMEGAFSNAVTARLSHNLQKQ